MTVVFDKSETRNGAPTVGTLVELHGLQKAQALNGQKAVVSKPRDPKGRIAVLVYELDESKTAEKVKEISVKPNNLKPIETMEFIVKRINVQGGGTLIAHPDRKDYIDFRVG